MKRLSTFVLFLMLTSASSAADPGTLDPSQTLNSSAIDWSGFHVGIQGGYLESGASAELASVGGLLLEADVANGTLPTAVSGHGGAALLGFQAGYTAQVGRFILGVEGDVAWANADGSVEYKAIDIGTPYGPPIFAGQETVTAFRTELDSLSSLRLRAGLTSDAALFYVTAGLTAGHVENGFQIDLPGLGMGFGPWAEGGLLLGYTVGLGVEFGLTENVTGKLEYLHYDLSDRRVRATDDAFPGQHIEYRFLNGGNLVRGGLNFRF